MAEGELFTYGDLLRAENIVKRLHGLKGFDAWAQEIAQSLAAERASCRALTATDVACYKWPGDTDEHKALRAAFVEGACSFEPNKS